MSILTQRRPTTTTTSKKTSNYWLLLIAFALGCLSFGLRLMVFQQSPYPNGWHAYHYLLQADAFGQQAGLQQAEYNLLIPLLYLLKSLIVDPIQSFTVLCALIPALFTMAIFRLSFKWQQILPLAILLGCWSIFSPHLTYFSSQHPKELLGLVCFIGFLGSIERSKNVWTYTFLILAAGTHWLGLGCCMLYFIFYCWLTGRKKSPLLWLSVLGMGGMFLWGWQLLNSGAYDFPFSPVPQFAPYSFLIEFGANGKINFEWFLEIADATILWGLVGYFILGRQKRNRLLLPLFLLCGCLIFPFLQWDYNGLADMGIFYFILLPPLLLPILIRIQHLHLYKWPYLLSVLFLLGSLHASKSYQPVKHDPNYEYYEQLIEKALPFLKNRKASHLIAHAALAEMTTYQKKIKAVSWIPSENIPKAQLWRLAKDIRPSQLEYYLSQSERRDLFQLDRQSWIIREDLWQSILAKSAQESDTKLLEQIQTWRNPQLMR
ncbi:MAG: hypothetical protein AAF990_06045 [Bacteroidota bacterium]